MIHLWKHFCVYCISEYLPQYLTVLFQLLMISVKCEKNLQELKALVINRNFVNV